MDSLAIIITKLIFLSSVLVVATIGNSSVLVAIHRYKDLQTIPNFFVANLAVADLLFSLIEISVIITRVAAQRWILGHVVCQITGFINTVLLMVSVCTLATISVNRYYAVRRPFKLSIIFSKRRSKLIIFGIWMFSLIVSSPPLYGWSEFYAGKSLCIINGRKHLSYAAMLGVFLLVCAVSLTYFYFKIYRFLKLRKAEFNPTSRRPMYYSNTRYSSETSEITSVNTEMPSTGTSIKDELSMTSTSPTDGKLPSTNHGSHDDTKQKEIQRMKNEARTTKMLLVVVITFFACWTPIVIISFLYVFGIDPKEFVLPTFAIYCTCINGAVNPIIYGVMGRKFRHAFKELYKNIICCRKRR